MPHYGIKEQHFYTMSQFSTTSMASPAQEYSSGRDTATTNLYTNVSMLKYEDGDSVSKQKRDFSRYIQDKKRHQAVSFKDVQSQGGCTGDNHAWLEEVTELTQKNHEDDHFLRTLTKKAPNAELTANLLDEVMELRNELEKRIKELGEFKEEIRQVGNMVRRDPLQQDGSDTFVNVTYRHQNTLADLSDVDSESQPSSSYALT